MLHISYKVKVVPGSITSKLSIRDQCVWIRKTVGSLDGWLLR